MDFVLFSIERGRVGKLTAGPCTTFSAGFRDEIVSYRGRLSRSYTLKVSSIIALIFGPCITLMAPGASAQQGEVSACVGADTISIAGTAYVACADPTYLAGICVDVYQRIKAKPNSRHKFAYEEKLHLAAGADITNDSKELVAAKLSYMWSQLHSALTCDTANFDVQQGNILKYAIKLENWEFLVKAAQLWRVPLNYVDVSDGRTVLDYIDKEINRTVGSTVEQTLRTYQNILIRAGAKRASEL